MLENKSYNRDILLIITGLRRLLEGNTANFVVATQSFSKPQSFFMGWVIDDER